MKEIKTLLNNQKPDSRTLKVSDLPRSIPNLERSQMAQAIIPPHEIISCLGFYQFLSHDPIHPSVPTSHRIQQMDQQHNYLLSPMNTILVVQVELCGNGVLSWAGTSLQQDQPSHQHNLSKQVAKRLSPFSRFLKQRLHCLHPLVGLLRARIHFENLSAQSAFCPSISAWKQHTP